MKIGKKYTVIILTLIIIFSTIFRLLPFIASNYRPYSWDGLALVHGANKLLETQKLQPDIIQQSGFSPIEYSQRAPYYSTSQIFLVFFHNILHTFNMKLETYNSIVYLSLLLNIVLILLMFINTKLLFDDDLALISAVFISFNPTITRDILWTTIHSLLGYVIIFSIFLCTVIYIKYKYRYIIIPFIILLYLLYNVHAFSFTMLILSSLVFSAILLFDKYKKYVLLTVIIIPVVILILYFNTNINFINSLILELYIGTTYFMNEGIIRFVHPIWTSINNFGYPQFVIGIIGILKIKDPIFKKIHISFFSLPIIFSSSHLLGFNYFGDRFVTYAWIPLYYSIPYGFAYILKLFKKITFLNAKPLIISLMLFSSILNCIVYQEDFVISWVPSLPKDYDIEAINWLKDTNNKNYTILTIHYWPFASTKWIPVITGFNTSYLNIQSILAEPVFDIDIYPPMGLIGGLIKEITKEDIINDFNDELFHFYRIGFRQQGYETFVMFKYPDSDEAMRLVNEYNIKYIYIYKNRPEDIVISGSYNYDLIYSNIMVNIYEAIF